MKPSIGRIVLFHPQPDVVQAAMITFVHSDTCVNLAAFDSNGNPYGKTSVPLVQEGEPKPQWPHCTWMPYQVGQAKKQELNLTVSVSADTTAAMERIIQRLDKELENHPG